MKNLSVLLFVFSIILSVCIAETITHSGQPGCKTEEELEVKYYRNNWDPTKYWICMLAGVPGAPAQCEQEFLFLIEIRKCIHHSEWNWTPPIEPPSRP